LHDINPGRGGLCLRWRVERQTIDPLCRTKVDERFMKVPRENIRWNHGSIGHDFREFVGSLIVSPRDVVELEAVELVLRRRTSLQ
jgi:hypothetical protein